MSYKYTTQGKFISKENFSEVNIETKRGKDGYMCTSGLLNPDQIYQANKDCAELYGKEWVQSPDRSSSFWLPLLPTCSGKCMKLPNDELAKQQAEIDAKKQMEEQFKTQTGQLEKLQKIIKALKPTTEDLEMKGLISNDIINKNIKLSELTLGQALAINKLMPIIMKD
jgi:hypothetical protein